MSLLRRHLEPYEPDEIAQAVNGNERSAEQWRDGRTLPSALYFARLRAWLPGFDAEQRRLEEADRHAAAAHAAQYGAAARLQDGD